MLIDWRNVLLFLSMLNSLDEKHPLYSMFCGEPTLPLLVNKTERIAPLRVWNRAMKGDHPLSSIVTVAWPTLQV